MENNEIKIIADSQSSRLNLLNDIVTPSNSLYSISNNLDNPHEDNHTKNADNSGRVMKKTDVDNNNSISVETMLEYAGDFGRYQILLMVLFSIVNVLAAFHYFAQTFITVQPKDFKCDLFDKNQTFNYSIDDNFFEVSPTDFHSENETRVQDYDKCKWNYSDFHNDTRWKSILKNENQCSKFIYDKHFDYESIITEFNWVCDDAWKAALGQSMYFIGAVTGCFFLGIVADKFGRVKSLIAAYLLALLGNTITVVSDGLEIFAFARFVAGLATDTNFVMMYIIVMEYTRPSMRTFGINICIGVFYCLGCGIVPWIAVALKTWRSFLVSVSVPMVIVPSYYLIMPESASWLLTQGNIDKAMAGFSKIAQINGKTIPDDIVAKFKEKYRNGDKPPQASLAELFRGPKLRRKMMILILKTMTLTLCYDAIWKNVNFGGVSPFSIFSLGSLTILPGSLVVLGLQDRIGRKALFFLAILSCAVLTSTCGFMNVYSMQQNSEDTTLLNFHVALAITARLCIVVAYNSGAQYAAELIPTIIRGRGVALIHLVGYAASFLSPYLLYLGEYWPPLPDLTLGTLCFLCALATLLLPETMGRILPATVEDGELFGEGDRPCDFVCCNYFSRQRRQQD